MIVVRGRRPAVALSHSQVPALRPVNIGRDTARYGRGVAGDARLAGGDDPGAVRPARVLPPRRRRTRGALPDLGARLPPVRRRAPRLLRAVDEALGHPDPLDMVDVGAGRGELLVGLRAALVTTATQATAYVSPGSRSRPGLADLPADIAWSGEHPHRGRGLVVANEWLDNVPVDVVVATPTGARTVLVDPATGAESEAGPPPDTADLDWLERWWPLTGPGAVPATAPRWVARGTRRGRRRCPPFGAGSRWPWTTGTPARNGQAGRFAAGTLAGYRGGRQVPRVPDGSCDVTGHVALDACAAAGVAAGARATVMCTQREALTRLGVGSCPSWGHGRPRTGAQRPPWLPGGPGADRAGRGAHRARGSRILHLAGPGRGPAGGPPPHPLRRPAS